MFLFFNWFETFNKAILALSTFNIGVERSKGKITLSTLLNSESFNKSATLFSSISNTKIIAGLITFNCLYILLFSFSPMASAKAKLAVIAPILAQAYFNASSSGVDNATVATTSL